MTRWMTVSLAALALIACTPVPTPEPSSEDEAESGGEVEVEVEADRSPEPDPAANHIAERAFRLHYRAVVPPHEAPVHLWLPLPREAPGQRVEALELVGPPGERVREAAYGNAVWHVVLEPSDAPLQVGFSTVVRRQPVVGRLDQAESRPLTEAERQTHARDLAAAARVPIGADDPVLGPVLADVRAKADSDALPVLARTIYDHVIDTMEYKKVGTGWGHGDTYWACSEKYGNCTDFHSVYLSLARTVGIPARFEMGFPVPSDRTAGKLAGYHCWLQFWLPGAGWVPLDASEADKHPDQREAFYGAFPADRVLFTIGRDLRLGPDHRGEALNYFIYPYAELGGQAFEVGHEVSFEVLREGEGEAAGG